MGRPFSGISARLAAIRSIVANADRSNRVNLSKNAAFDGWPVWSPDGKRITFSSDRAGPARCRRNFCGQRGRPGLRQLTSGPGRFAGPSWSSDGRRIMAVRIRRPPGAQVREYRGNRVQLRVSHSSLMHRKRLMMRAARSAMKSTSATVHGFTRIYFSCSKSLIPSSLVATRDFAFYLGNPSPRFLGSCFHVVLNLC